MPTAAPHPHLPVELAALRAGAAAHALAPARPCLAVPPAAAAAAVRPAQQRQLQGVVAAGGCAEGLAQAPQTHANCPRIAEPPPAAAGTYKHEGTALAPPLT